MIDPELKSHLQTYHQELKQIERKSEGLWRSFVKGVLGGLGSVVGVALALVILGWILNSVGVIPAFKEQAKQWQKTLDEIKKVR